MDPSITEIYGNKVRVRVCGLCWQDDRLLMANHKGLTAGDFWSPPGGGIEFGQSVFENLAREFREETGLVVEVGAFLFGCEHLRQPLHSVELFFETTVSGGKLTTGSDPELQIIKEVRFFTTEEISLMNSDEIHGVFRVIKKPEELNSLRGFYRI